MTNLKSLFVLLNRYRMFLDVPVAFRHFMTQYLREVRDVLVKPQHSRVRRTELEEYKRANITHIWEAT